MRRITFIGMINYLLKKAESSNNRKAVKHIAERMFSLAFSVLRHVPGGNRCPVCGAKLVLLSRRIKGEKLVQEWKLDSRWENLFNQREGEICISCGASLRVRQLSLAFVRWMNNKYGTSCKSASEIASNANNGLIRLAEINSCGALHKMLSKLPQLAYSEYGPDNIKVRHEDLLKLTYPDKSFDLVLHSDTIEHAPDVDRALSELLRILKPGGATIFSTPIVRDGRATVVRAILDQGEIKHLLPPSYHGGSYQATSEYLVCYEFGRDLLGKIEKAGFQLDVMEHDSNPAAMTLLATRPVDGD